MFRMIKRKDGNCILEISPWVESVKCDDGTTVYMIDPIQFDIIKEELIEAGIRKMEKL